MRRVSGFRFERARGSRIGCLLDIVVCRDLGCCVLISFGLRCVGFFSRFYRKTL